VKFLSQAGKEVHLKLVAQAILTYCMSVFKLPGALCKEINGMMQRFWWGHKENQSKIHWMNWERMGRSKIEEGLGFVTWWFSIKLYWQNKFGGYSKIPIL
jgi:hypothetical protein